MNEYSPRVSTTTRKPVSTTTVFTTMVSTTTNHRDSTTINKMPVSTKVFLTGKKNKNIQKAKKDIEIFNVFFSGNVDYWKKGDGRKTMLKALNSLRTEVDDFVLKNPSQPNETEGRALSNVITTQIIRDVIKKFVTNVNPAEFFKNGGDDKKLAILLVRECQENLKERKFILKAEFLT